MKVAAMFADGSAGTVDRPDPQPIDDFVLVKIHSVPMCTEYKGFKNERDQDFPPIHSLRHSGRFGAEGGS